LLRLCGSSLGSGGVKLCPTLHISRVAGNGTVGSALDGRVRALSQVADAGWASGQRQFVCLIPDFQIARVLCPRAQTPLGK
jgi:hypothetical protein